MNYLSIISIGLAIAVGLGTAFGIAYAYFNKNKTSSSVEVISLLQKEVEVYRDQLKTKEEKHASEIKEIRTEFTKQVTDLTERVGRLQGQYDAEKAQKEEYELILKDKNPKMEKFMELMIKAVSDQGSVNKEVVSILKDIHTMAMEEHDRDIKITSTITKTP